MTTDTTIDVMPDGPPAPDAPFGTVFGPAMAVSRFDGAALVGARQSCRRIEFALHPGDPRPALRQLPASKGSRPIGTLTARVVAVPCRRPRRPAAPERRAAVPARATGRRSSPTLIAIADRRQRRSRRRRRRARCTCARRCSAPTSRSAPPPRPSRDGDPLRARLPGRRLPAAAAADRRRRDDDAAHDAAVRRRQDGRQLRHGAVADHGGPRAVGRRPGAVRAGRRARRRPARPTCC